MKKDVIELRPTIKRPKGTRLDYAEHEDVLEECFLCGNCHKRPVEKRGQLCEKCKDIIDD